MISVIKLEMFKLYFILHLIGKTSFDYNVYKVTFAVTMVICDMDMVIT